MLNVEGRKVKEMGEAKEFIKKFINSILHSKDSSGYVKHYDMDIYLPMMMDWILNVPAPKEEELTSSDVLEVLYMDAAWELCLEGCLRPGPRAVTNEIPSDALGKGYSLTPKGKLWLAEAPPAPAVGEPPHPTQP